MTESAVTRNRRRTAAQITRSAQRLAEERGLDGFTMDDLAEVAGVSRRTLFNYVEGKFDAVLGAPAAPDPARLVEFSHGGPTGRLHDDLKAVFTALLDTRDAPADELDRTRRLIASDARLHKAMHDKFARSADLLASALVERDPGRFDAYRAKAAATVTLSLFDVALEGFVADPGTGLADHFVAAFDGAAALFGSTSSPGE
ncbi:TetR/AcrR family transcriptional regulator [Cellulosimicrobium marinum]|uniref:TetR/AcrR family transcriptional regulator n=1 Tax=Cellulosimicrobium marinum TaxID=1638992 RepID=UPI001E3466D4|nr:TetR/AcrR family transcriptional regulator [Cellulosimicrobium marinum]MCB7136175.1 TetR/AcrR family transcriptional regulator [Cellulosimicrobium marinum]